MRRAKPRRAPHLQRTAHTDDRGKPPDRTPAGVESHAQYRAAPSETHQPRGGTRDLFAAYVATVSTSFPRTWPLSLSSCARFTSRRGIASAISTQTSPLATRSAIRASCAGYTNETARTISYRQGEKIKARPLTTMLEQIAANNRAGGWRKLTAT